MMWFVVLIVGTLLFALAIDIRRNSRGNDRHTPGINPGAKPGEDTQWVAAATLGEEQDNNMTLAILGV